MFNLAMFPDDSSNRWQPWIAAWVYPENGRSRNEAVPNPIPGQSGRLEVLDTPGTNSQASRSLLYAPGRNGTPILADCAAMTPSEVAAARLNWAAPFRSRPAMDKPPRFAHERLKAAYFPAESRPNKNAIECEAPTAPAIDVECHFFRMSGVIIELNIAADL